MTSLSHYVELFCQSNFSFLQGASHADELVIQASFLGYQATRETPQTQI